MTVALRCVGDTDRSRIKRIIQGRSDETQHLVRDKRLQGKIHCGKHYVRQPESEAEVQAIVSVIGATYYPCCWV